MKTQISWKTEITGRDFRTCTGNLNDGSRQKFFVGQKVQWKYTRDAADGGEVTGIESGLVTRISEGTEHGMHGTTALMVVQAKSGTVTMAARHFQPCEW